MSENGKALAVRTEAVRAADAPLAEWTDERRQLLARTIAKDCSQDELALFIAVSQRTGLDPFVKQIHAFKSQGRLVIHVGIDGRRTIAHRTGLVNGTDGPYWTGPDGVWRDIWLEVEPPAAARFTVYRKGAERGFSAVARWSTFNRAGVPIWKERPDHMLAKVAEDHAWRRAFPYEMAGMSAYRPELDQETDDDEYTELPAETKRDTGYSVDTPGPRPEQPRALASDALVREVQDIRAACKAHGIETPLPADRYEHTLAAWLAEWRGKLAGKAEPSEESGFETSPHDEGFATLMDGDDAPEAPPMTDEEMIASFWSWKSDPIGREVSELVDQLSAVGAKFSPPKDAAPEVDVRAWISQQSGWLRQRGTAPAAPGARR